MIENERDLIGKLNGIEVDESIYEVVPAKQGGITVLLHQNSVQSFLHSKYNPVRSGEQFAKEVYSDGAVIVLYGLGLGYHVAALQGMLKGGQILWVFETNLSIVKLAFEQTDIRAVLESENVRFFCGDNLNEFVTVFDEALRGADGELQIYMPSLKTIPREMEKLKDILTEYKAAKDMQPYQGAAMQANAEINEAQNYRSGMRLLKGCFEGMPAIVVSAGASLNQNIGELKQVAGKAVIVAVSRIAKRLAEEGIEPDFFVTTDAADWVVANHLDFETMRTPLFLLSTADSNAKNYPGEKLIVYEKSSAPAGEEDFAVETGGSVATCALSICTILGADPIIMIGQDLCYVSDETHSTTSSMTYSARKSDIMVRGLDGEEYPTSGSLHIYLKWIERFIARKRDKTFLNATAQGAEIIGARQIKLVDFLEDYADIVKRKVDMCPPKKL